VYSHQTNSKACAKGANAKPKRKAVAVRANERNVIVNTKLYIYARYAK
jgi:hypothetical protein